MPALRNARIIRLSLWLILRGASALLYAYIVYTTFSLVVPLLMPLLALIESSSVRIVFANTPTLLSIASALAVLAWPYRAIGAVIAVFSIAAALLADPYLVAPRLPLLLTLFMTSCIFSSFSTRYYTEKHGSPDTIHYLCKLRCKLLSILSFIIAYLALIGITYYSVVALRSIISYMLSYTPSGLLADIWVAARSTRLLQAIVYFTFIGIVYAFVSRIVTPLGLAIAAPPEALARSIDRYLGKEYERLRRRKSWYQVIHQQALGYVVSIPSALIGYSMALMLLPYAESLIGGYRLPGILVQAIPIVSAMALGTLAYYAGRWLMVTGLSGPKGWIRMLVASVAILAVTVVALGLLYGFNPAKILIGLFTRGRIPEPAGFDVKVEKALTNITRSLEDSEKLLELAVKLLWG
ncbi:MAG: hypothetical protein ABWW69_02425 [Pyrodictiaceae archaeon]